ncbi:MAG: hypothetical protein ABIQ74_01430 [Chitinophagales bacterium]
MTVERFEKDLFSPDTISQDSAINKLIVKYGDFFFFYFNDYSNNWKIKNDSGNAWHDSVITYTQDRTMRALYDSVEEKYDDLTSIKNGLTSALRYYKYYFPEFEIPKFITLINAPSHGAFTYGDSLLCIALDDYMGPLFSFYKFENVPQYLIHRFSAEYIIPNCIQVLSTHRFPFDPVGKKLLDAMIYNGKVTYLKSMAMPGTPDSLITGFSKKDLQWCDENEKEIWKFFIAKNLLYSQDPLEYLKYVNEGPSTSGMPPQSPGNTGSWVGWKIVSSYMKGHPEISLPQLMREQDAQKILTESKYKP